jgi:two-component system invasion response regulator UvrY
MKNLGTSVLLVDDHAILREGYQQLLESAGFNVIGQAGNSDDGYQAFISLNPDVCIIDLTMPGKSGLECIRRICLHNKNARILVCSMHDETSLAMRAMELGAIGYITKSCSSDILIDAVTTVARKNHYLAPDIAQSMAVEKYLKTDQKINSLSHQEFAIFSMLAKGMSIEEMSKSLSLSPKTVSNYKANMMRKLGTGKLVDVIFLAQKIGLINSPNN